MFDWTKVSVGVASEDQVQYSFVGVRCGKVAEEGGMNFQSEDLL